MPAALKPRKSPSQGRSTHTVEAIVEAAIRILRDDGWAAVTTTRIAQRAGVSVGSLYQYFPSRESIAVEIVRRRTRAFLETVLAVDLAGVRGVDAAAERFVAAFVAEKRRSLDLSLAIKDAHPEVQGRHAIIEEARTFVPALQAKLAGALGRTPDPARLALSLAVVEGAVWEALSQDPGLIEQPETLAMLGRLFTAALGELSP
ncbi:TetR/AcrR family transcriptional regulator [Reyranella sp.]|uniref:TetR/AcrR family transcriptional regulator n=1 Tax=Reyranella sp. TaxID=1929291 RepID=UPI003BAB0A19